MQAQRLDKPWPIAEKPLSLVETAVPQPGAGQIRLKVLVCGMCHTDLHA